MKSRRLALVLFIVSAASFAQENGLAGVWEGKFGRSHERLTITDDYVAWKDMTNRDDKPCRTTYKIISKYTGNTYPDNHFALRAGVTYDVYKLKLTPNGCIGYAYLLFALPSDGRINRNGETFTHAEVLGYSEDDRYVSYRDFGRTKKD